MPPKAEWERLIQSLISEGLLRSPSVIRALREVSRDKFLPENMQSYCAVDSPLPIGSGQTVSAPHMVAIMDEALELEIGHKILEVGSGSGWHASTIAEIVAPSDMPEEKWGHVYTTEIVPELADSARAAVEKAGYSERVTVIATDGSEGYAQEAPYDRILVTAAAPSIPKPLPEQLKPDGILVIPVGSTYFYQTLLRVRKNDAKLIEENLGGVAFVPLTGKYGHRV